MVESSELNINTNDVEMGLFLASTLSREEVEEMGLCEVVQERLHTRAAAPGITSKEILERGPKGWLAIAKLKPLSLFISPFYHYQELS